jgi:hypothetical protein
MIATIFIYAGFLFICFIVVSIADAMFNFSGQTDKLQSRCFYMIGLFAVLLYGIYKFHDDQSLLKVEDHGFVWVKDNIQTTKVSLGDDVVLFMTEDKQVHLTTKENFQDFRFDSNSTNKIALHENAIKIF